ncbi:MAG: FMN-binding protein, partial [Gemmatimonadota bacterium]
AFACRAFACRAWRRTIPAALWFAVSLPAPGSSQVFLSQEEALRLAFPEPATIERRTAFLSEAELASARRLAGRGIEVDQSVVTYYVGRRNGATLGVAYFDVHRVRTLPEAVMVVVTPPATIERIEILKFSEPPDYLAPAGWLEQFRGRSLSEGLSLKGEVVAITGATLTSRAITRASRRVLALHQVIRPFGRTRQEAGG